MTGLIPKKSEFKTHSQKKAPENSVSATLSRNTALLHSCFLSAVQQLHSFSQHLKFSSQIQHSTQHSTFCTVLCCGVQGSTLNHSPKQLSISEKSQIFSQKHRLSTYFGDQRVQKRHTGTKKPTECRFTGVYSESRIEI